MASTFVEAATAAANGAAAFVDGCAKLPVVAAALLTNALCLSLMLQELFEARSLPRGLSSGCFSLLRASPGASIVAEHDTAGDNVDLMAETSPFCTSCCACVLLRMPVFIMLARGLFLSCVDRVVFENCCVVCSCCSCWWDTTLNAVQGGSCSRFSPLQSQPCQSPISR